MSGYVTGETADLFDPVTGRYYGLLDRRGLEIPIPVITATGTEANALKGSGSGLPLATSPRTTYAQLPVASFGDSIANIATGTANFDIRQASGGGVYSQSDARMGLALIALSNGAIRTVANCGVDGDNTTQMLARDAAGSSATRKAITDAVSTSARTIVFSAGINDGQALAPGASNAVIAAAVATSVDNVKKLCRRVISLGSTPLVPALLGYTYTPGSGLGTATAALVPTVQEFIRQWNAAMKAAFTAAGTAMGYFEDSFVTSIVDANGAWLPGLDQGDGLHPSINGCNIIYAPIAFFGWKGALQLRRSATPRVLQTWCRTQTFRHRPPGLRRSEH